MSQNPPTTPRSGPFEVIESSSRIEVRSGLTHRLTNAAKRATLAGAVVFLLATLITMPDLIGELGRGGPWGVRLGLYAAVGLAVSLAYGVVRGLRQMTWGLDSQGSVLFIDEFGAGPARQWEIPFDDIAEIRAVSRVFGTGVEVVLKHGDAYPLGIASSNRVATEHVVRRALRILSTES